MQNQTNKSDSEINNKFKNFKIKKKLVNIMRRKRFPFMDMFAQDNPGFGHGRSSLKK